MQNIVVNIWKNLIIVKRSNERYKYIMSNYDTMFELLFEQIKNLSEEIEELKEEIKKLKNTK